MAIADLSIAAAGLLLIGVGLWWHDPGASLTAVGAVLLIGTIISRLRRTPNA
tara:strand:+ start:4908 stop:5063 length:156 start_codon:yes stop_codon:yes gene_type:complete